MARASKRDKLNFCEVEMLDFKGFLDQVQKFETVALTAPAGPDGDSVGTQCALRELLLQLFPEKKIRIINEDPCPPRYQILSETRHFEIATDVLKSPKSQWPELWICVDGGSGRIGDDTTQLWGSAKKHGQVDHHVSGGGESYEFQLHDP